MADLTPAGKIRSFGGSPVVGATNVASIGFPSVDRAPVEAYAQTLGQSLPVDLLNGVDAPRKDTLTADVLIRAADTTTDPAQAWAEVVAGYRGLAALPQTGTLLVDGDASGGGTVSCTARRKPLPLKLAPKNARHLVVSLEFVLLTDWV